MSLPICARSRRTEERGVKTWMLKDESIALSDTLMMWIMGTTRPNLSTEEEEVHYDMQRWRS
jgi:hypothetical protein